MYVILGDEIERNTKYLRDLDGKGLCQC